MEKGEEDSDSPWNEVGQDGMGGGPTKDPVLMAKGRRAASNLRKGVLKALEVQNTQCTDL